MEWQDKALLLWVKQKSKDTLVMHLLTERHGRCQCALSLKSNKAPMLLPGSELRIAHSSNGINKMGSVKIIEVDKGIVPDGEDDVSLTVVSYINELLTENFSQNQPMPKVFHATEALFSSFAEKDDRWPLYFACWEMTLLEELGLAEGLQRCRPAYRQGEAIYLSKKSGRAVTRTEAGAFLDRMVPVPSILMGARNCKMVEVHQALELTTLLADRSAGLGVDKVELPEDRAALIGAISRHRSIPQKESKPAGPIMSENDRRKRLLSLKPLMVSSRRGGA